MQPDAPERADSFETYQRGVRWQRAIRGLTPLQRVDEESDRLDVARLEYDNREQGRAALSTTGADVALAITARPMRRGGTEEGWRPAPVPTPTKTRELMLAKLAVYFEDIWAGVKRRRSALAWILDDGDPGDLFSFPAVCDE